MNSEGEGAQGLGATRTERKRDGLFHSSLSASSTTKRIIQTRAGQYNDTWDAITGRYFAVLWQLYLNALMRYAALSYRKNQEVIQNTSDAPR